MTSVYLTIRAALQAGSYGPSLILGLSEVITYEFTYFVKGGVKSC